MSAFYDDLAATAAELLEEFGQAMTLKKLTGGAFNDETQTVEQTEVVTTVQGAAFPYDAKAIVGTQIQQGDVQVFLSPIDLTMPDVDDVLNLNDGMGARDFKVIAVKPIAPAGQPALVEVQVRSA